MNFKSAYTLSQLPIGTYANTSFPHHRDISVVVLTISFVALSLRFLGLDKAVTFTLGYRALSVAI